MAEKITEADFYTPPQAARVLGLSRRRVTQMLNDGGLDGEKLGNGRWRISTAVVAQLLKERSQRPLPPSRIELGGKALEELTDRAALLEHRIERLTDSLTRLFTRLELLEDKVQELDQELTHGQR